MHDRIRSSEVINPAQLSEKEKKSFSEALYQLHSRIFAGVGEQHFVDCAIDPPAEWTRIQIFKNARNEWVGYCAVHRFHKQVFDRPYVLMRAEAGILREYRGRSLTLWFGFAKAMQYRLLHPFCPLYYLGTFVNPSVFYMFSRYFREYYPCPDKTIPPPIKNLMLELARIFEIKEADKENFLARDVGWITRESDKDRLFWQNHGNPAVKFYLKNNPGYSNGNGLLVLVPLTFRNIFLSLLRFIKNKLWRKKPNRRCTGK